MGFTAQIRVKRENSGRLLCQVTARAARGSTPDNACWVSQISAIQASPGLPYFADISSSHIEVTPEANGNLWFWHFRNKHVANRQRTVLWLNGGPGCSSEDGALMEIGPYRVKEDQTLRYVDGSWDEFANLLFVDNPVGTGFSYVNTNSYVNELTEMADQMVKFLEKWFTLFPEYENNDVSQLSPNLSHMASKLILL